MKKLIKTLAYLISFISSGLSLVLYHKNKAPRGFLLWPAKLLAGALAPYLAVAGALGAVLGAITNAPLALFSGLIGAGAMGNYVKRLAAGHDGFSRAFGPDWEAGIPVERRRRLQPQRWAWKSTAGTAPRWGKDIVFAALPLTGRRLLCDIWQPPLGTPPTGLAFLYFHGSGWATLDKDFGTRTFFRALANQGHVVMDVAYRLAPETDLAGMVGDVKRAVAWMKANAGRYGVDPQRVVVGGGSAGGHLALLAAYAPDHPDLTPDDLISSDLSVCGVIAEYAPADLTACYYHTNQHLIYRRRLSRPGWQALVDGPLGNWLRGLIGDIIERLKLEQGLEGGSLNLLLGGDPDEIPEIYTLYSPLSHVHPRCPPTLLIQGEDDLITPLGATRDLYNRLARAGVPAVLVAFPQTEHAFDLVLPELSPSAQAAFYDVERFLALMAVC